MVTYSYDQNGIPFLKFNDFKSNEIKKIEYVDGKLYITNKDYYYYTLNFSNLITVRIQFADGIEKKISFLNAFNALTIATAGDDWIIGTSAADQLSAKAGNDRIFGGAGDDTYQFAIGDGNDTVTDSSGNNTVQFMDVNASDIIIQGNVTGLELKYSANDSIIIDGTVNNYKFLDGTILTQDQLLTGKSVTINGTINNETISGYLSNDTINAGTGDDTLNGNAGNDNLKGETGNDTLNGGDGTDILNGGIGNDVLKGNAGNDIYQFAKGDGVDIINDFSDINNIVLSNIKSTEVQYSFDHGTLNIQYGITDTIKIENFLTKNNSNFSIQFSDGVTVNQADFDATVGVNYWVKALAASTNINSDFKYLFPTSAPDNLNASEKAGWSAFSQAQQDFLIKVFQNASSFSALTFTLTDNSQQANTITAQRNSSIDTSNASAYAYFPSGGYSGSDIFFSPEYSNDPEGKWSGYLYPHELGHALGLSHSFENKAVLSKFGPGEESVGWTVMSYSSDNYKYDGKFQAFDIAALQAMYGVNTSARAGNDSYQFNNTIGTLVWDGAGTDTINASTATQSAYINLNQGSWSYIGDKSQYISTANQLSINLGTQIENAVGSNFNDTLIGNGLDNQLNGGAGNDTLNGGWGNDTLNGDAGADSLDGGVGDDTYYVDNINDKVIEGADIGIDKVFSSVTYNLFGRYVETLELMGTDNINATGNGFANTIIGNSGNNVIDGWGGADTMTGGTGNDTYYVDNIFDKVIEGADGGVDKIFSSASYSLAGKYIETMELTGTANINASGNALSNNIIGNSGNNVIDGWGGADTMTGGLGNDTYYVDHILDKVIEGADGGIDKIFSSVSYNLGGRYVETLELTGTANINITGNSLVSSLIGNSGNNVIDSGAGNDTVTGGLGSDTAMYKIILAANATGANGLDTWTDFTIGDTTSNSNADKINVHDLLIGYNGAESSLVNYIALNYTDGNTVLSIDRDGSGTTFNSAALVTLNSVNVNLATLLENHQLMV